jgi:hypothetical protein
MPYLQMDGNEPVGQLGEGWYPSEGNYRWSMPRAVAQVNRPNGAGRFELRVLAGPAQIKALQEITVRIALDDLELKPHTFTGAGVYSTTWDLAPAPAGPVRVTIFTSPSFQAPPDIRTLGVAVVGLGFPVGDPVSAGK